MAELTAEPNTMQEVRVDPRIPAAALPSIGAVKLSPGDAVTLINISATGILVEGRTRFVPRTRVTVSFEGGVSPLQVKGRVVRCQVASIVNGQLCYQSGIQFDVRVSLPEADVAQAQAAHAAAAAKPPAGGTGEPRNRW
jgi:hypothetical protein